MVDEVIDTVVEPASEAIREPLHEPPRPIATPTREEDDNVS
jgi:hypothetical protein